jgi:fatty acid desaturase
MKATRMTTIFAIVLLVCLVGPAIILGIYVAPWFLLIMLGLVVIPLLFIDRGVKD